MRLRIWLVLGIAWISGVGPSLSLAQNYGGTLIIGKLSGNTDQKALTILTAEGPVKVYKQKNLPFLIIENSRDELILKTNKGQAYLDSIVFRFFDSERALVASLITDEVDFATLENEDSVAEVLKCNRKFRVIPVPFEPNTVVMLCYNNRHPILRDKRIRQALTQAINCRAIIEKLLKNKADPAFGPLNSDSWAYNPHLKRYPFNPQRAVIVLKRLGWKDTDGDGVLDKNGYPFRFSLIYEKGLIINEEVVREIKFNLNEIGIDVLPLPLTKTAIKRRLKARDFDSVLLRHRFQEDAESLGRFFSSTSEDNFIGYQSPTLDNYINLLKRAQDVNRRRSLLQGIQAVLARDLPVTFLYFKWNYYHLVNCREFDNFLNKKKGRLNPLEQWFKRSWAK